jgi:nucleolar GTP-binding protein
MRPENLPEDEQLMLKEIAEKDGVQIVQLSCHTDEGVIDVRNTVRIICMRSRY